MSRVLVASLLLVLAACGADSQPSAAQASSKPSLPQDRAVYEVRTQTRAAPANFVMSEPTQAEKDLEVSALENEFRQYADGEVVRATYRYLTSGDVALIESAAYIGSSPAYAHYMGAKDGKLISVICVANEPHPGAVVSSSNCADAVGEELGAVYQALIVAEDPQ